MEMQVCDWFWGSCACDLPAGDHTIHKCGLEIGDRCSEYDSEKQMVHWMLYDTIFLRNSNTSERQEAGWTKWTSFPYGGKLSPLHH